MSVIEEISIKDAIAPVSIKSTEIILDQMKNCVCKIHKGKINGTGFFIRISYNNKLYDLLVTNNHVLNEQDINTGKIISISLNNEQISKEIKIDSNRKKYTNKDLDITNAFKEKIVYINPQQRTVRQLSIEDIGEE